ncbi:MAG: glycine cleavage system protein GcvH [Paracholeplasma sp.]|uniref:Glycine cleavage system H protein n=1 Tax=Acholeplasma brassicae TaxID=61635 RepID=U4KQR8_9MOLU|nr:MULTISPECIES: glycine cleavage system protein GcvH [Paracholeplasma]MDY3196484.1 glycine cleavage system protein GcvH [Paracholeplasma sp.]CCV65058.1 Glycine cleavage system H protein [Paracholeplasma brassicae]
MAKVVEGLFYSKSHEWVKIEGNKAFVGISDYAQESLGAVVFVDLPSVGDSFSKDEVFGAVESVKAASDLLMPIKGKVTSVNEALLDQPELLNEDPYLNFILEVELEGAPDLSSLMDASTYLKESH